MIKEKITVPKLSANTEKKAYPSEIMFETEYWIYL